MLSLTELFPIIHAPCRARCTCGACSARGARCSGNTRCTCGTGCARASRRPGNACKGINGAGYYGLTAVITATTTEAEVAKAAATVTVEEW